MTVVALLDPSIGSDNVGDEIIYTAVRREIDAAFDHPLVLRFSSHEFLLWNSRKTLAKADHVLVGGSSLLKSRMEWNTGWKLGAFDLLSRPQAILLGCGWHGRLEPPSLYSRLLYRRVLSSSAIHSVRDQVSLENLKHAGIESVLNTACVTMWDLDEAHCASIPVRKAERAVVTVTGYSQAEREDQAMIDAVFENYREVFLFIQQPEDEAYAQRLAEGRFARTVRSLATYDELLEQDIDYVGTRLHGGIRALQKGHRALIIAIDNRAREIAKDTNLPVILRENIHELGEWLAHPQPVRLSLPREAIDAWRSQFAKVREPA